MVLLAVKSLTQASAPLEFCVSVGASSTIARASALVVEVHNGKHSVSLLAAHVKDLLTLATATPTVGAAKGHDGVREPLNLRLPSNAKPTSDKRQTTDTRHSSKAPTTKNVLGTYRKSDNRDIGHALTLCKALPQLAVLFLRKLFNRLPKFKKFTHPNYQPNASLLCTNLNGRRTLGPVQSSYRAPNCTWYTPWKTNNQ
eukprot:GHVT01102491.1.p1 GENE.GHVT01102491.1~~GHVT01102491.1.p1  ORF type:complete len:199 (+),score=14.63 GHVT01102491.1:290-886(+)